MIADSGPSMIEQEDIFFACPNGRLKVRTFSETEGELIFYKRPDSAEPRSSLYNRSKSSDPRSLCDLLSSALGIRGIVRKKRTLYIAGQTRIHLDEVENLGSFIELEKIGPEEEAEKIQKEMMEFLAFLGVPANDRVMKGYDILMLERQG